MICAINYENVLNFVKVMTKILLVPFFPDTVYCCLSDRKRIVLQQQFLKIHFRGSGET